MSGRRDFTVRCTACAAPATYPAYRCDRCGGPLVLDLAPLGPADHRPGPGVGAWRYAGMLPRTRHAVSLGEGGTPLVPLPRGQSTLYAKLESLNPSLSFKDRAMAVAAATALDLGLGGLVLASSGNAAVSAATYAAAAGLRCRIYCATGSNAQAKLDVARAHGATVELVDGHYSDAYARAVEAEEGGWLNVTTTYRNPLLAEAYRPVAAELVERLGAAPDAVVVPIGAGPLLHGVLRGFEDLRAAGVTSAVPRMVGVQAAACAPLARAWRSPDWRAALAEPVAVGPTAAAAIADALRGYADEGLLTLAAVRDSGGTVVAVDEARIAAATADLARRGLLVEPAAATALAALDDPAVARLTGPGSAARVVLMLTGHGAKEPAAFRSAGGAS
ncbi:pyridoxal-phosphate dependent enzyme [Phytohabitans sp. ZYX-F-186]|uniref:Pyridoxal-phosphate dependent enzyme n=1 Tax=Phytohabitans maris TaxID=3071409 RepID=A0ABU0ZTX3_9ACTN|nr:pyridoxal-phosphate dependent enzyme [Phytohabitans sp. ZYX-F-186]MDQ7909397.1 pyridoxal-phosphate dependent enzyme [Phytohabitans sp. ZYX-F-186]